MIVTNNGDYAERIRGLRTNFPFGTKVPRQVPSLGRYHKPESEAFMHAGDAWDYDWLEVEEFGSSYRMSTPQAAVGRVQLKKLDRHIALRSAIVRKYDVLINDSEQLRKLSILPDCGNAWYLFPFFVVPETGIVRDELIDCLQEEFSIKIVLRYWPIHLGGVMRMRGHYVGECPVYERVWFTELMSLPISPQMKSEEIDHIVESIPRALTKLVR